MWNGSSNTKSWRSRHLHCSQNGIYWFGQGHSEIVPQLEEALEWVNLLVLSIQSLPSRKGVRSTDRLGILKNIFFTTSVHKTVCWTEYKITRWGSLVFFFTFTSSFSSWLGVSGNDRTARQKKKKKHESSHHYLLVFPSVPWSSPVVSHSRSGFSNKGLDVPKVQVNPLHPSSPPCK